MRHLGVLPAEAAGRFGIELSGFGGKGGGRLIREKAEPEAACAVDDPSGDAAEAGSDGAPERARIGSRAAPRRKQLLERSAR